MDTQQKNAQALRGERPAQRTAGGQSGRTRRAPASRQARPGRRTAGAGTKAPRRREPQASKRRRQNARTREEARRASAAEKPSAAPRRPMPEVVYTPPKAFNRNRLLLRLTSVAAVVLALTLGISIFFKVKVITVSGAAMYTPWEVREASGIQEGEGLLSFGQSGAAAKIISELPYVESVRIGIKLPDTVNIEIKELSVSYAVKDQSGFWWLISSDGKVLEQVDSAVAGSHTQVLGVTLSLPAPGAQAVAAEAVAATQPQEPGATDAADASTQATIPGVSAPAAVAPSERLNAALQVLQYLEANSMMGKTASVNVEDLTRIVVWYGTQYEIVLGDTSRLAEKVSSVATVISEQLKDYEAGTLDISYTIWTEGVGYTPFS